MDLWFELWDSPHLYLNYLSDGEIPDIRSQGDPEDKVRTWLNWVSANLQDFLR